MFWFPNFNNQSIERVDLPGGRTDETFKVHPLKPWLRNPNTNSKHGGNIRSAPMRRLQRASEKSSVFLVFPKEASH
jgi:hypothetical protein